MNDDYYGSKPLDSFSPIDLNRPSRSLDSGLGSTFDLPRIETPLDLGRHSNPDLGYSGSTLDDALPRRGPLSISELLSTDDSVKDMVLSDRLNGRGQESRDLAGVNTSVYDEEWSACEQRATDRGIEDANRDLLHGEYDLSKAAGFDTASRAYALTVRHAIDNWGLDLEKKF